MTNSPSWFDWLSFFGGGALGSFITLYIQKKIDDRVERLQFEKQKAQATKALKAEIEGTKRICQNIIDHVQESEDEGQCLQPDYTWAEEYLKKYIDYLSAQGLELYETLSITKQQVITIQEVMRKRTAYISTHKLNNVTALGLVGSYPLPTYRFWLKNVNAELGSWAEILLTNLKRIHL